MKLLDSLAQLTTNGPYQATTGLMRIQQVLEKDPEDAGAIIKFEKRAQINQIAQVNTGQVKAGSLLMEVMHRYRFLALHNVTVPDEILHYQKAANTEMGSGTVPASSIHPDVWEKFDLSRHTLTNKRIPVDNLPLGHHTDGYPFTLLYSAPKHVRPNQPTGVVCRYHAPATAYPHGNELQIEDIDEYTDSDYKYAFHWDDPAPTAFLIDNGFRKNPSLDMDEKQLERIRDIRLKHFSNGGRNGLVVIPIYRGADL